MTVDQATENLEMAKLMLAELKATLAGMKEDYPACKHINPGCRNEMLTAMELVDEDVDEAEAKVIDCEIALDDAIADGGAV